MESKIIRINSFNVRGISSLNKRTAIFSWLKKKYSGIHFLQETHSTEGFEEKWMREWNGEIKFCHGTSNSRGVAILFDNLLDVKILETIKDNTGRLILINCILNDMPLVLINVYCPTKDNEHLQGEFLNFITETLEKFGGKNVILAGDFNTYLNIQLDKKGGVQEKPSSYSNNLNLLLDNYSLVDIWRVRNPDITRYTRRENSRCGLVQSRLDYFLVSKPLQYMIRECEINPSIKSDHSLVSIKLCFVKDQIRGKGFWKMNTKLLLDKDFKENMKTCIEKAKAESESLTENHKKWEYIKCMIRGECIRYSIKKSKEEKLLENDLTQRLKILEEKIDCSPDIHLLEEHGLVKHELEYIYNERAKGVIMRSRCQWVDENEKCTKFFLNQEKMNYNTKHIKALTINENFVETDPKNILEMEKQFYKQLYSDKNKESYKNIQNYISQIESPKISRETKKMCDEKINEDEIIKAIKDLPNKKTPGPDGIPVDFYKIFWNEIKEPLIQNFLLSKEKKILPSDQRRGIINLIPKEGKDIRFLKNWRPITLLNSDYKILTKVMAKRMEKALCEIINPDQIGYMKGRFCGENTRLIADLIEYSQIYKKPGIILLIDFEKAFDTINWPFLHTVLNFFNFGENFRDWIHILYRDIESCVTNNGYASDFFAINRGIRQGDPISALLFLPVAEILALLIRNDPCVNGYVIRNKEIKLCQLADDITLFLINNESVRKALSLFEEFYRYAGLKLNKTKTVAIIIYNDGTIKKDEDIEIIWNNDPFKTLGIWYSTDIDQMLKINITNKLEKITSLLNMWSGRCLSLKGKITVLKSIIMPHILHVASVFYISDELIKKLDNMFIDFVWSNRKHGVARGTLVQPIDRGGLKMVSIHKMIWANKIMWVKRLMNDINAKWKSVSWFLLGISEHQLFSKLKINYVTRVNNVPFYNQILQFWYNLNTKEPITYEEVLNEYIFDNSYILIGDKPISKSLGKSNLVTGMQIKDILSDEKTSLADIDFLSRKYNTDYLTYRQLISAIPKQWKKIIERGKNLGNPNLGKKKNLLNKEDLQKTDNRTVYNILVMENVKDPCSKNKWIEYYPFLETAPWSEIYAIPFKICRDTYIQSLQYKILHRILNCNYNLFQWGINKDAICNYCDSIDTLEHFLFDCKEVFDFWNSLQMWLYHLTTIDIKFTKLEIIFGITACDSYSYIRNFVILHGKKFIYLNKKVGKDLFLLEFLNGLKQTLLVEKELYCYNEKLNIFEEKLGTLLEYL